MALVGRKNKAQEPNKRIINLKVKLIKRPSQSICKKEIEMNIWENKILDICIQKHFVVMALEETDFECQIQFRKRPK